ncbi:MAG: PAS domain-containing protein, partial [Planctomycetaceae bacterium]|nr:PAS domain-containing protein [Planctomycetaceae bacterium]
MNDIDRFQDSSSNDEILQLVKAAIDHVSYSVMITTADLVPPGPVIVYVTPAFSRMTGFPADEIIGKSPRVLQGPNTDRSVLRRVNKQLSAGQSCRCEIINYRKDGSEYVAELAIDPVHDMQGRITHWVAVQQDVTNRRRAEQTLAQAERLAAIGAAMAGLSHESRNALQRMHASLDELATTEGNRDEASQQISAIRHSLADLFQLYEDVREFAAPLQLNPKCCFLDDILEDTWVTLALQREGRLVHFDEHLQDGIDLRC